MSAYKKLLKMQEDTESWNLIDNLQKQNIIIVFARIMYISCNFLEKTGNLPTEELFLIYAVCIDSRITD